MFLAYIHCTIECTPKPQLAHGIPFLFDSVISGPFSAPMYMFAMGIGMVYTRRRTPRDYVRKGIRLGITGFLLNVCRFLLSFLIGYLAVSFALSVLGTLLNALDTGGLWSISLLGYIIGIEDAAGRVFSEAKRLLCESNSERLFITAFEGVLDLATGAFNYVNAGHEMPFICRAARITRRIR